MTPSFNCPKAWHAEAHTQWSKGDKHGAIALTLKHINSYGPKKPVDLALQLCYYIFLIGDPGSAAQLLEVTRKDYPHNFQLLQNLAVCLTRCGQDSKAVEVIKQALQLQPENYQLYDTLCNALSQLGEYNKAIEAGTQSLILKEKLHSAASRKWALPQVAINDYILNKQNVIAFSLWGSNARYLRGAIDNAILGPQTYSGWVLRFYVDETVPAEILDLLRDLGAEILQESSRQTNAQKLTWRFKVADDPTVGRFLVRDVDSVLSVRERLAVDEWVTSDCWFHIMRDWYTHTDLILAGMWGGIAVALPSIEKLFSSYKSPAMETPNIDQWFLRDKVWAFIQHSCLIHDRFFRMPNCNGLV